ncbi:ESCRT-0 subunit protein hse1 [Coemansia javaensis]|uniref:Class E vacuolar protein-sorting machinery protein HSE1 n=1 Tax=Coemansia javaensis TaxID=2761396 RepID=A0A9W8H6Z4_9FUNG|nr:ESCRT-0 subunit protein hse1 [Coemansia javaensis]
MFKVPNPFDEVVKKTTSELLTAENWELIMEVCDRVGTDSERARQCFEVINERMLHRNANVVLYTMTLVHSLVENCGPSVRPEVASRAFTTTLTRVLNDKAVHEKVKSRILGSIQQWAFDFRQDPTLSLMEETYTKLRAQRFPFPSPQKPDKVPTHSDLERQKEEEDLQLALALSLTSVVAEPTASRPSYQTPAAIRGEITRKQTIAAAAAAGAPSGAVTRRTTRAGAAPGTAAGAAGAAGAAAGAGAADGPKRKVQVKARFDFTPTEEGELGFYKGDVIDVLDQKYRDWWRGELRGKTGIFPANFVQLLGDIRAEVTRDVDAEVEVFSEAHNIEALLRMLGSIDPLRDNVSDNEEVQRLYSSTTALRPKIVKLIEKYNRKKEELIQLDSQFSKSIQLYDELMQRSASSRAGGYGGVNPPVGYSDASNPHPHPPPGYSGGGYGQQSQIQQPQQPQQFQQAQIQPQPQQYQQQQPQQPQIQQQPQQFQPQQPRIQPQPQPQPQQHFAGYPATSMVYSQPMLVQQQQQPQQQQQQQQPQPQQRPGMAPQQQMYYAQQQQQPYQPQAFQGPPPQFQQSPRPQFQQPQPQPQFQGQQ